MCLSIFSLIIETPAQYARLKNGEIGEYAYRDIVIKATAHPQILLEPKFFLDRVFTGLHFFDRNGNFITMFTYSRAAVGHFKVGQDSTLGMPAVYIDYALTFEGDSIVTANDISYIFTWIDVQYLTVLDTLDAPVQMLQRIDEFSHSLTELIRITFNVHPHTYKQLNVRGLVEGFEYLSQVYFRAGTLNENQVKEFIEGQELPSGWTVKAYPDKSIEFSRSTVV